MFMGLEIKPKVGDLVRANDPYFEDLACGYCIKSEKKFFTVRYFDDDQHFSYWHEAQYKFEMSIISGT